MTQPHLSRARRCTQCDLPMFPGTVHVCPSLLHGGIEAGNDPVPAPMTPLALTITAIVLVAIGIALFLLT